MELRDLALFKAMTPSGGGSSGGGSSGGSGGSTIDEIMQANGYTAECPWGSGPAEKLSRLVANAVFEAFKQFDGQYGTGYSSDFEVVPYFNNTEYKVAFVIQ